MFPNWPQSRLPARRHRSERLERPLSADPNGRTGSDSDQRPGAPTAFGSTMVLPSTRRGGRDGPIVAAVRREPWNKGKLVGQKAALKVKDIGAIRVRLQIQPRTRELALFDRGIDSKPRGCDSSSCASVTCVTATASPRGLSCFSRNATTGPIRDHALAAHLGRPQYARIVDRWVEQIDLDPAGYGANVDLSPNEKSESSAAAPWPHEAREHGEIPRH